MDLLQININKQVALVPSCLQRPALDHGLFNGSLGPVNIIIWDVAGINKHYTLCYLNIGTSVYCKVIKYFHF